MIPHPPHECIKPSEGMNAYEFFKAILKEIEFLRKDLDDIDAE